jgi:dihydroorotate dehydrogenase (NAD+) catalytic subunit
MAIEITRPNKNVLIVETPVMPAAGTFGFGEAYPRELVNLEKLGAIVTNPVTLHAWRPATGTRVVPLDAGVLLHTGLPNRGLNKTLEQYREFWKGIPLPVILHLVGTTLEQVRTAANILDEDDAIDAIELGLNDDVEWEDARRLVQAAVDETEKPILVRLPFHEAGDLAEAALEGGAGALVVAAPPRGTARDPISGKLVSGRVYGPLVKPMVLRLVGQLSRNVDIPIIGSGGIHSPQDARDFLEAGARAVQVDSVTWLRPNLLEVIARDLGGWVVTRESGAFPDEWHPGMGDTEREAKRKAKGAGKAEKEA